MKNILKTLALNTLMIFLIAACDTGTGMQGMNDSDSFDEMLASVSTLPKEELNENEISSLLYIREEEKLARDVYIVLYDNWTQNVFNNISLSEQKHTDAVKLLLDKYELEDPAKNDTGIFGNTALQALYDTLTAQGEASLISALEVGALIEEVDILDIQHDLDNGIDNQDIRLVYDNLVSGSKNHLRAFVRNLQMNGITYSPVLLEEDTYLGIISN